jgi:hypothetical protein
MTIDEALALLGLDASATEDEVRRALSRREAEFRERIANAPSDGMRARWEANARELPAAASLVVEAMSSRPAAVGAAAVDASPDAPSIRLRSCRHCREFIVGEPEHCPHCGKAPFRAASRVPIEIVESTSSFHPALENSVDSIAEATHELANGANDEPSHEPKRRPAPIRARVVRVMWWLVVALLLLTLENAFGARGSSRQRSGTVTPSKSAPPTTSPPPPAPRGAVPRA